MLEITLNYKYFNTYWQFFFKKIDTQNRSFIKKKYLLMFQ